MNIAEHLIKYRYVGEVDIKQYICKSTLTLAGISCVFKSNYGNFLKVLLDKDIKINLKKCKTFYGKEFWK
jgi:hypothetical protein